MRGHMDSLSGRLPALATESLPEACSEGAMLMARYCSQCHNLPAPGMHRQADWPTVLARMFARLDMMQRWSSR